MSKVLFTGSNIFVIISVLLFGMSAAAIPAGDEKPIIITSQTFTADNKNNVVIFEGSVVAKNEDLTMYSDKMEVFFDGDRKQIMRIRASGNVKALKNEQAIFADDATYSGQEETIVFTGAPKAVDGENVITGMEIIYFLKENRTVVKNSRVLLKKKPGMKDALTAD